MTEETKKKGFLKRAASNASKAAGKAAGSAITNAKDQAKAKATDFVAKQAEKALKEKLEKFKNKK